MTRSELTQRILAKEIDLEFITMRDVIRLHDESISHIGGTAGLRDAGLLESAVNKPLVRCVYEDELDPLELACTLADGIVQNHAFIDGNKRAGFLAMQAFLKRNRIDFDPESPDAYNMFRRLAAHEVGVDDLVSWCRREIENPASRLSIVDPDLPSPT